MERQLFSWKTWVDLDFLTCASSDCTVVKAFGPFAVGDKLSEVIIDSDNGTIVVHRPQQAPWRGKLTLPVEAA